MTYWFWAFVGTTAAWVVRELLAWRAARRARRTVATAFGAMGQAQAAGAELGTEVVTLRGVVESERRRADSYLGKIDEVIGERDDRFRRAQRESSGHAVAQDMMMREIESLTVQCDRLAQAVMRAKTLDEAQKIARRGVRRNHALNAVIAEILGPDRAAEMQAASRPSPNATAQG